MSKIKKETIKVPKPALTPTKDKVLIFPDPMPTKTEGGIDIPDTAKGKPTTGTIVAVGPGTKNDPMESKVGDRIKFSQFSGEPLEDDKIQYLLMREVEILATY